VGGYGLDLEFEEANKLEGETKGVVDKGLGPDVKPASPEYLQPLSPEYPHLLPPEICQHPAHKLARPPHQSDRAMMVSARPEIHLVEDAKASKDGSEGQFNFGDGFGCGVGTRNTDALMDEDNVTLVALEEMLRGCGGLEDHKRGGPNLYNPGPPFAVGDEIMSNVCKHGLQQAFVLRADHPRYQLRLEDRSTIGTSMHESWLRPRYATWQGNLNGFAPDQDDPFVETQQTISATWSRGKIGSYGILGDTQLESFRRIEEAKEFAKAVKADDAKIPVHLWNDRVKAPCHIDSRLLKTGPPSILAGPSQGLCCSHEGGSWTGLDGEASPTMRWGTDQAGTGPVGHCKPTLAFDPHELV
jgi:hypothetical protein